MSHHHLNILPVEIPDVQVEVGVLPFSTKDALKTLRKEHGSQYIFKSKRDEGDDLILALKLDGGQCELSNEKRTITLGDNLGLVTGLIRERFIASFSTNANRRIVGTHPLKVLSSLPQHDFIRQAAADLYVPDWLVDRLCHSIEARVFSFDKQSAFVGLVLDYHTFREVSRPCSEWTAAGFNLKGLYVSEKTAWDDHRIKPRARLVGRVASVSGSILQLEDCRDGKESMDAGAVEIEADYDGFMQVLSDTFGREAKAIERRLFDLQSAAQQGPAKYAELLRLQQRLMQHPIALLPGIEAKVQPHLDESREGFPEVRQAPHALFVFDPTFNKPAFTEPRKGIADHGPYSQRNFTPSKPRICVVCQASRKGEVEQFIRKLLDGNVEPGRQSYFPHGLIKTYRLQDREIKIFTAENDSAAAYRKAAVQALASVTSEVVGLNWTGFRQV